MVRLALAVGSVAFASGLPWMEKSLSAQERAQLLVGNLTTKQKVQFLHGKFHGNAGSSDGYIGFVDGIPELGIPDIKMNDGPQGFRAVNHPATSTNWPAGMTIGSTWDEDLARQWGAAMGKEFFDKGANIQLGPGLNVARIPNCGRNFEYVSGEDPHLGAKMAPSVIQGIQSQGVVANAKHWVDNSQETHRGNAGAAVNEVVDERTQWEIYYPPFEASVKAGVGSFMCSYNKVNGKPACASEETLKQDLKDRMGFKGWVMSDWLATHSLALKEGLDQEMPFGFHYNLPNVEAHLITGKVTQEMLDESVTRIFTPLIEVGAFDHPTANTPEKNVSCQEHNDLARKLSAAATVLLKNNGDLLPIKDTVKTLAVLGKQAKDPIIGGGGSGFVSPAAVSVPFDVLSERFAGPISFGDEDDKNAAASAAQAADLAVVFVGTKSQEGSDRKTLALPQEQVELIEAVAKAQPNVVVVMATPGPILTGWRSGVPAILLPWMPGQEFGAAISDVLFGDICPSAKLTHTMPNSENDRQIQKSQWPGIGGGILGYGITATYSERLEVGYRWYHAHGVTPAFAFGHGLSYTNFNYSTMHVDSGNMTVSFEVQNVGSRAGAEVCQLYLSFPASAQEPPRQLKGFQKLMLQAGEKKRVTLPLSKRDLSIWDAEAHDWQEQQGEFDVEAGSSSADIRLSRKLQHVPQTLV